jgi:hypothetical protein
MTNQAAVMDPLLKKQLDREVPYKDIPLAHRPLYHLAEKKEWDSWRGAGCVEVLSREESDRVRATTSPARIIKLRFVYRDKNSGMGNSQMSVPIKAKARLCAQASREPLALAGELKLDSPTVQRSGNMVFLQLIVNLKWLGSWYKGDITAAFLQGRPRDQEKLGQLFLVPPSMSSAGSQERLRATRRSPCLVEGNHTVPS